MPDHGAVEAVLRHDGRLAPALLSLTPLGSTVLEPHLTIGGADASMAPGTSSVALALQHY